MVRVIIRAVKGVSPRDTFSTPLGVTVGATEQNRKVSNVSVLVKTTHGGAVSQFEIYRCRQACHRLGAAYAQLEKVYPIFLSWVLWTRFERWTTLLNGSRVSALNWACPVWERNPFGPVSD